MIPECPWESRLIPPRALDEHDRTQHDRTEHDRTEQSMTEHDRTAHRQNSTTEHSTGGWWASLPRSTYHVPILHFRLQRHPEHTSRTDIKFRHRGHTLRVGEASRRHAVQASRRHARAVDGQQREQTPRVYISNIHQAQTSITRHAHATHTPRTASRLVRMITCIKSGPKDELLRTCAKNRHQGPTKLIYIKDIHHDQTSTHTL